MKDYWDIASQAFPSISRHADAHSAGLLDSLRLSAEIKPLTATAKAANGTQAVLNPMVGCQITLEGIGVQWASAQVCTAMKTSVTCSVCPSLHGSAAARKQCMLCTGFFYQQCQDSHCVSAPGCRFSAWRSVWLRAACFWCKSAVLCQNVHRGYFVRDRTLIWATYTTNSQQTERIMLEALTASPMLAIASRSSCLGVPALQRDNGVSFSGCSDPFVFD